MRVKNSSLIINIIVGIISLVISGIMFLYPTSVYGYNYYFLVPFLYGICIIFSPRIEFINFDNIGPTILNVTMLIKYSITPLVSHLGDHYYWIGVKPDSEYLNLAVLFTIIELLTLFFTINFLIKKGIGNTNINDSKNTSDSKMINRTLIHFIFVIISLIIVVIFPQTIADQRFIFNQSNLGTLVRIDFPLSGLFTTIFNFGRYCAVLLVINYFYKKNLKKESFFNLFGAFLPVIINSLFTSNLSRLNLLVPLISFVSIIYFLFDSKKMRRITIKALIYMCVFLVLYMSVVKFFGVGRGNEGNGGNLYWWGDTLNMYFSGVKDTAIGIKALPYIKEHFIILRPTLFFNDTLSHIIGISNFIDQSHTSTILYNYIYFGSSISKSQIVPNIVEGYYYFGYLLFLLPMFLTIMCYHLNNKFKLNSKIDMKFAYQYSSLFCGMMLMVNYSMIISYFINVTLLFAIISIINKKMIMKRK